MVKLIASTPSVKIYNTTASAIAISGNDVYISGFGFSASKGDTAIYWKNGTATIMAGRGEAHTIGVIGNDVYLGGDGRRRPCFMGKWGTKDFWPN